MTRLCPVHGPVVGHMLCPVTGCRLPTKLLAAVELGALGGASTSPAKRQASAANGRRGGRPKKRNRR
jgi:hypothetical protein